MIVLHSAVANVKMRIKEESNNVRIEGCGCRFRNNECEHLCDNHRNEFILKLYNRDKNISLDVKKWLDIVNTMNEAHRNKE